MKLKLVVVDLELSRRQKTALAAALGAAVLMVGAVAVADVPNTFVAGDTLTAAGLNENFDDIDARLTAQAGSVIGVRFSTDCGLIAAGVTLCTCAPGELAVGGSGASVNGASGTSFFVASFASGSDGWQLQCRNAAGVAEECQQVGVSCVALR